MNDRLIEIGILGLSTLVAPLLPRVVGSLRQRTRRRKQRLRRKTDRSGSHEGQEPSSETGWVQLSFVFLLSLSLALSLDIYVAVRQAGQEGLSSQTRILLNDLTVFLAVMQTLTIAFFAALPIIRREYQAFMVALDEARTERAAIREMLSAGLEQIDTRLNNFNAAHAKIQRSLVTRDKGLVALVTKVRDEQAEAYDEVVGLIGALNQKVKGLNLQSQDSIPGRKAGLRR